MFEKIDSELRSLCRKLNRGSLNYTASMAIYFAPNVAGRPLHEIVQHAVSNDCKLGGQFVSTSDEIIRKFTEAAMFAGDSGSHANPNFASSEDCMELFSNLVRHLRELLVDGDVYSFCLAEGHPFYPVFWGFAFLIECPPDAYVLIGSSSD